MISVRPEADYDCIYCELVDETSRVKVHLHSLPGSVLKKKELRQIEVSSTAETVFAVDRVGRGEERLPCDMFGIGGNNDFTRNDSESNHSEEHDEDGTPAENGAGIHVREN
jgi:hypothetical protein